MHGSRYWLTDAHDELASRDLSSPDWGGMDRWPRLLPAMVAGINAALTNMVPGFPPLHLDR
jgi:hypothetical protein